MSDLVGQINQLPKRIRDYIHDLETNADPAGTIREVFTLKENQKALTIMVENLRKYARHTATCSRPRFPDCNCGLERVLKETKNE